VPSACVRGARNRQSPCTFIQRVSVLAQISFVTTKALVLPGGSGTRFDSLYSVSPDGMLTLLVNDSARVLPEYIVSYSLYGLERSRHT